MDREATNFDSRTEIGDGTCKYAPFIIDPDFEAGHSDWSTYSGNNFSPFAFVTNTGDGFMPTNGQHFLKCLPTVYYYMGTWTKDYVMPNKHYKGFCFDYSYTAIAGSDSILTAKASIEYDYMAGVNTPALWVKTISETPASFTGFPNITIQKKDEYVELPYTENNSFFAIKTSVSKGTFTFQIDNFREVLR